MLGAIIGDVIGSRYEWNPIKTKNFELLNAECKFTDDTVMTVAVADSLMNGEPYVHSFQKWGRKYPMVGYGRWFNRWLFSENPEPYNSFGNGSAMRSSSIGWLFNDEESVLKEAEKSAEITHNHPEGIKGAQAVALGIFMGRSGRTKKEIRKKIEVLFGYSLRQKLSEIRPGYNFDVTCQGSVPQAIIAFLESNDFEDSIRNAISLGGDGDTQACITGSLAEAYYTSIPDKIKKFVIKKITPEIIEIVDQLRARTEFL